jgi:hypothetical protein
MRVPYLHIAERVATGTPEQVPSAYWLADRGFSVVFGGPRLKADDVIARDVEFVQRQLGLDVLVGGSSVVA